jgi:cyclopropane fatty-acyl-phospholipid synthase-like methyltransferase
MNQTAEGPVPSDAASAHYDRVSEAWRYLLGENLHYGIFSADESLQKATDALTALLADMAGLEPGLRVLDVGCGIGTPAAHLARTYGCTVVGISTSSVGIGIAAAKANEEGLSERLAFRCEDAQRTSFEDLSFDRAWVMESSHLMEDKRALLSECFRVLRPLGRVALCDIVLARRLPIEEVLGLAKEFDLLRRVFGRAKMLTLEEYRDLARSVGFAQTVERDLTAETSSTFDRWEANADRNEAQVRELIGEEALQRFREACRVLRAFWRDGIMGYGALAASKR